MKVNPLKNKTMTAKFVKRLKSKINETIYI